MKKVISLFIAICFCICAAAQKPVVVVDHFTSASCKASDLINLRNHVITGIHETGNVNLIDVEAEATLAMEAERRSSELSLSDQTARIGAMKTLGANYVITGTAAKLGADRKRSDYYTGNVVFTLKVVNTEDGTIVGAETYQYSDISAGSASSADGALY
jgi:curli biogenesis system outer membrane secretion channel CsgG